MRRSSRQPSMYAHLCGSSLSGRSSPLSPIQTKFRRVAHSGPATLRRSHRMLSRSCRLATELYCTTIRLCCPITERRPYSKMSLSSMARTSPSGMNSTAPSPSSSVHCPTALEPTATTRVRSAGRRHLEGRFRVPGIISIRSKVRSPQHCASCDQAAAGTSPSSVGRVG